MNYTFKDTKIRTLCDSKLKGWRSRLWKDIQEIIWITCVGRLSNLKQKPLIHSLNQTTDSIFWKYKVVGRYQARDLNAVTLIEYNTYAKQWYLSSLIRFNTIKIEAFKAQKACECLLQTVSKNESISQIVKSWFINRWG